MSCGAISLAPDFYRDSSYFFRFLRNFFLPPGIYKQANTRPASRPPSDWLDSPRGEIREAGRPGPPPFSFPQLAHPSAYPKFLDPLHRAIVLKKG